MGILFLFIFFEFFETGSHYVAQVGLKLMNLLTQPPKYWDYRCEPACLARGGIYINILYCIRTWALLKYNPYTVNSYIRHTVPWSVYRSVHLSAQSILAYFCYLEETLNPLAITPSYPFIISSPKEHWSTFCVYTFALPLNFMWVEIYSIFCDWLLLFSQIFPRFIITVVCTSSLLLFNIE
jgi:hypothetical protein